MDYEDFEEVEVIDLDDLEDDVEDMQEYDMVDEFQQPDLPDLSKLTFTRHSKSVFCCDLSKDGNLAATGGEDDSAFVWSTSDGNVKFECTGHTDSIISVSFNHNNELVATGDMSGKIQVWNVKEQKVIWIYEGDDIEWSMWHSKSNVLISGSHSGEIFIWQVPQGNCKVLPSHGSSCTSGKLLPDGKQLIAGYEDGHIKLWDIKQSNVKWQFTNTGTVTSLDINSDGTLCSVAPSSHLIKVSDGKLVATLLLEHENEIETHMFSSELNLLVTGSLSGRICVWDLHTKAIRHRAKLDHGVTVMKLGSNGKAFISSVDGSTYVCDLRTGALCESLSGHKASVLSLCLFVDNRHILTTSDDTTAKIFPVNCE